MSNLLSIKDVADYTGLKIGYLYQLTSKRKIPHYKPLGKKIFFKREEVDEFFFQGKKKSLSELDKEASLLMLNSKK
jgi:excisionase family DNA binding protein